MSREIIKDALKSFGLTEKEAEIYIFLAKYGPQSVGDIAKQTKTHRPHMYRIISNLERKGVVESTLESPVRFIAIPFEEIINENIRKRQQETILLEKAKNGLLQDWNKIYGDRIEPDVGKFFVIEGNRKIYSKISKMIKQTKSQFSAILTVPELVRNEQFGVFDVIYTHPYKYNAKFQFLTELSSQNLEAIRLLQRKLKTGFDLKARNPSPSFSLLPRMVARDNKEILFFISPKTDFLNIGQTETCICTDNISLLQTLLGIFEELWRDSTEITQKILEIETVEMPPVPHLLDAAKKSRREWLILETIQYYLKALELMKDQQKWAQERIETLEALGSIYGLVAKHEKANECFQRAIESTDDIIVKERIQRKIRWKRIVENDGVKLAYYVYGQGEPTIFLLSWTATAEMWIPQITYFSQKYKVVTMDLRGSGESDKPPGEYTIDKHVDDLKVIIDDLGDENIVFLGSFVGAKIAVKYITGNPGKIAKLVLLAFDPSPISSRPGFNKKKFEDDYERSLKNPSWRINKFWDDIVPDPRFSSLKEWGLRSSQNTPPTIFVNSLYNFHMEDVRPLLKRIDVPILLLYGDLTVTDLERVKRLKKMIPYSEIFIFKGVSYCLINLKDAKKFNNILENFINTGYISY